MGTGDILPAFGQVFGGNFCGMRYRWTHQTPLLKVNLSLANKFLSSEPQRQEFACANVLLDSMETRNFVQAMLF
jgi:hypothetical protein